MRAATVEAPARSWPCRSRRQTSEGCCEGRTGVASSSVAAADAAASGGSGSGAVYAAAHCLCGVLVACLEHYRFALGSLKRSAVLLLNGLCPARRRMRIALGLKPLKMEAEEPKGPSKEALAAKEAAEKEAKAAELAERIKQ